MQDAVELAHVVLDGVPAAQHSGKQEIKGYFRVQQVAADLIRPPNSKRKNCEPMHNPPVGSSSHSMRMSAMAWH